MKKNNGNKKNIIIAIGDIHGSLGALELLYEKICGTYDPEMVQLVFLGDYCDRGESSSGVLDFLANLQKKYGHFIFLLGNHEYMILNGQAWGLEQKLSVLQEYPENLLSEEHWNFLESLKPYYESKNFLFVHGGVPPNYTALKDVPVEDLISWYGVRDPYMRDNKNITVITGHYPGDKVKEYKHHICIDTGCCFLVYGRLTALVLDDERGEILECLDVENPRRDRV